MSSRLMMSSVTIADMASSAGSCEPCSTIDYRPHCRRAGSTRREWGHTALYVYCLVVTFALGVSVCVQAPELCDRGTLQSSAVARLCHL